MTSNTPLEINFEEYQRKSKKTAVYPKRGRNIIYPTLGLIGESGEVANKVKKIERDDGGKVTNKKRMELENELGDILWYISQLATELKLSLNEIALKNIEKLSSRQKRGKICGDGDTR